MIYSNEVDWRDEYSYANYSYIPQSQANSELRRVRPLSLYFSYTIYTRVTAVLLRN